MVVGLVVLLPEVEDDELLDLEVLLGVALHLQRLGGLPGLYLALSGKNANLLVHRHLLCLPLCNLALEVLNDLSLHLELLLLLLFQVVLLQVVCDRDVDILLEVFQIALVPSVFSAMLVSEVDFVWGGLLARSVGLR